MKTMGSRAVLAGAGLLLALSLWAMPAAAQRSDDMKNGGQSPCVGDAQKLCNEFIPDRAKVASCLFRNKSKLAPACRAELGGGSKATSRKGHGRRHGRRHRRHR